MGRRIVIIGGVAGGASAATKARRTDEHADIVLFERGHYVSFANCGLPYYVGGTIPSLDDLLLLRPDQFRDRFRVDVRLDHEAVSVDPIAKRVAVHDIVNDEGSWEPYDKLILATGGYPIKPSISGIRLHGVHTLTTIPDAVAIRAATQAQHARDAVVVGAGFLGLEAVEALLSLGLHVHLVEKLPQVLPPLDTESAAEIAAHLAEKGVELHLDNQVTTFLGNGVLRGVQLCDGRVVDADLAVVAIGMGPNLTLAQEAGLQLGEAGGVVVDDRMRTSDSDIYACGDIVESRCLITGRRVRFPLAGPANKQGRVAGANAAGGDMVFKGALGTFIVKVCDLTAAKVGLSAWEAEALQIDHVVSFTRGSDHASYYPGAREMSIKIIAERGSGRLLGAQIVGPAGVDKRIDVFATAMYAGLTIEDLEQLDLSYAPPYSSAKDPANVAGFVAANINRGEVEVLTCTELAEVLETGEKIQLVDVRTPEEYAEGFIPGAMLIPVDELRHRLGELDSCQHTVVYCQAGYRSYHAYKILRARGFDNVANLSGGYASWRFASAAARIRLPSARRTQDGL